MRGAVQEIVDIVAGLEERLADRREWVCGGTFTMADLFWAVSLFRMKWLGMDFVWEGQHALNTSEKPYVRAYGVRLFARPAFREAIIDWPKTPRTEFVSEYYEA